MNLWLNQYRSNMKKSELRQIIREELLNEMYPGVGDVVKISDIDYDMMNYFNRTNRQLLVTLKNGKKVKSSVSKSYKDLVFTDKFPADLNKKDIAFVKIIK